MQRRMDSGEIHGIEDIETPFGVPLSGKYKRSFAYATIRDRLPVILTRIIDTLSRDKQGIIQKYGGESPEEIKQIIGSISKLKNELVTNKILQPLKVNSEKLDDDATIWNEFLKERTKIEGETPTWFNTIWLYCECYMYRRIAQEMSLTKTLKTYDPFGKQKKDNFNKSLDSITTLSQLMISLIETKDKIPLAERRGDFIRLLKLDLWGNRCDLSLSGGAESSQSGNPIQLLDSFDKDLLVNDTQYILDFLSANAPHTIDIVLDNAGYELFTDFCFATFLTTYKFAKKIRFYVKYYPWYVSDVTVDDFHWTLETMKNSSDKNLRSFGEICHNYFKEQLWTLEVEKFWTLPYTYSQMKELEPSLYAKLSEAALVIFKGDLNYRKLLGDIKWEYTEGFDKVLQDFRPTKVASLRTLKCDICVGLSPGQAENIEERDRNWLITGQYGVIQATRDSKLAV